MTHDEQRELRRKIPRVLLLRTGPLWGAGHIPRWAYEAGCQVDYTDPERDLRKVRTEIYSALIVLPGSVSVNDEENASWLDDASHLVRLFVDTGRPVLGLCFGAQLLAKTYGGVVEAYAGTGNFGLHDLKPTAYTSSDRLFGTLNDGSIQAVLWHEHFVSALPAVATPLLAAHSTVQAFRIGEHAWGAQFHPEADIESVDRWSRAYADKLWSRGLTPNLILQRVEGAAEHLENRWRPVVSSFLEIARDESPLSQCHQLVATADITPLKCAHKESSVRALGMNHRTYTHQLIALVNPKEGPIRTVHESPTMQQAPLAIVESSIHGGPVSGRPTIYGYATQFPAAWLNACQEAAEESIGQLVTSLISRGSAAFGSGAPTTLLDFRNVCDGRREQVTLRELASCFGNARSSCGYAIGRSHSEALARGLTRHCRELTKETLLKSTPDLPTLDPRLAPLSTDAAICFRFLCEMDIRLDLIDCTSLLGVPSFAAPVDDTWIVGAAATAVVALEDLLLQRTAALQMQSIGHVELSCGTCGQLSHRPPARAAAPGHRPTRARLTNEQLVNSLRRHGYDTLVQTSEQVGKVLAQWPAMLHVHLKPNNHSRTR